MERKKGRLFFGLVLAVLFVFLITGLTSCDDPSPSYRYNITLKNQSSYTISVSVTTSDVYPSSANISPRSSQTFGSNYYSNINFTYRRADGGSISYVYYDRSSQTFYNN